MNIYRIRFPSSPPSHAAFSPYATSLEVPEGETWKGIFILSNVCEFELQEEQERYQDLLFLDVKESYFTLTRKVCYPRPKSLICFVQDTSKA